MTTNIFNRIAVTTLLMAGLASASDKTPSTPPEKHAYGKVSFNLPQKDLGKMSDNVVKLSENLKAVTTQAEAAIKSGGELLDKAGQQTQAAIKSGNELVDKAAKETRQIAAEVLPGMTKNIKEAGDQTVKSIKEAGDQSVKAIKEAGAQFTESATKIRNVALDGLKAAPLMIVGLYGSIKSLRALIDNCGDTIEATDTKTRKKAFLKAFVNTGFAAASILTIIKSDRIIAWVLGDK